MDKKDRTAIAVSVIYMLGVITFAMAEGESAVAWLGGFPLVIYWAIRFVKDDISFIGSKS
jgi:hypothetical protein